MKRTIVILTLLLCAALFAQGLDEGTSPTTAPTTDEAARFAALDVFIDAGDHPLAAYQFELKVVAGDVALVGIEGGEHRAFQPPPYYDPAFLSRQRIVVAAFDTGSDLPRGRTRVARLMVQVRGTDPPKYEATIQAAAGADGKPIRATVSVSDTSDVPDASDDLEGAER